MNAKLLAPIFLGIAGALGLGYAAAQVKKNQTAAPSGSGATPGTTSGTGSGPATPSKPSLTTPSDTTPFVSNDILATETPVQTPAPAPVAPTTGITGVTTKTPYNPAVTRPSLGTFRPVNTGVLPNANTSILAVKNKSLF